MASAATNPTPPQTGRRASQQLALLLILAVEIALFSVTGTNFFGSKSAFEVLSVSVEIGLLALALTPVIISGGIDLSVGSLMGLCAVVFGKLWLDDDFHSTIGFNPGLAGALVATVAVGAAAGLLNGLLITRLRIPPLIVTLGSMSLFRGLAEGMTRGVQNFTIPIGHPFLFLGNGYFFGHVPAQLPILLIAIAGFWLLMHRSIIGRAIVAIGFSPEGARYAGIPVNRRIVLVYLLCGLTASVSSIVYVSHLGQAKSDAGTGYELLAITAVVLGGTSIFGGRGTVLGTLLGLLVISVLKIGLQLSDLHAELAGIMTGVLLLVTIIVNGFKPRAAAAPSSTEEWSMKNSQVAALSIVILLGALIVASSNWLLVRSLNTDSGKSPAVSADSRRPILKGEAENATDPPKHKQFTIAMMPKTKGNAYFIACQAGAEEAAKELNVKLLWDGPREPDPAKQNEIIETWMTRGVDAIAVAVENRDGIATALRRAKQQGIKIVTWDADSAADARDFFVNQATPEGIGEALMDNAARVMHGEGEFAIIPASLTASNMIEWQKQIELQRAAKYPNIKLAATEPCDDRQDLAKQKVTAILNAHPHVKLIMAICTPAMPGSAEAVKQSGRKDVQVIGLGLPNDSKPFVHAGITECVILWNTADLGYTAVLATVADCEGTIKPGDKTFTAGRVGKLQIQGDNIILGTPFKFDKNNIDKFDF